MVGNPSEPFENDREPLGHLWKGSEHRRNPLEPFGTLRKGSEHLRKWSEHLRTWSEHLRKWSEHRREWSRTSRKRLVFLPENPPNLSEPLRNPGRNILVKFEEEKGNVTLRARTRHLWRTNPTRSPLDYRVSHTARGNILLTCMASSLFNRTMSRPKRLRNQTCSFQNITGITK